MLLLCVTVKDGHLTVVIVVQIMELVVVEGEALRQ